MDHQHAIDNLHDEEQLATGRYRRRGERATDAMGPARVLYEKLGDDLRADLEQRIRGHIRRVEADIAERRRERQGRRAARSWKLVSYEARVTAVLRALAGGPRRSAEVAVVVGIEAELASRTLNRLREQRLVRRLGYAVYGLTDTGLARVSA